MPPKRGVPRAPGHLSEPQRKLWRVTVADYELAGEAHALRLLTLACEALDRCAQAREAIERHGLTFEDGNGNPRARPEVAVERDARLAAARLFRELALPLEDPDDARPPRFGGS